MQRKTEYPRHPTDYRNALAKERVFDKIIAKDRKTTAQQRKRHRYTREENECEASPSSCRTGSSPGRTATRQSGRAAPHMERKGRPGRRQRLLARHLHLQHHLCRSGVRRSFAAGLAAVRGRQLQRQGSAERQEHLHPRRRLLHLPCPRLRPAGKRITSLTVEVDNGINDRVYPQKADFTFYGGIYRDVSLMVVQQKPHRAGPLRRHRRQDHPRPQGRQG